MRRWIRKKVSSFKSTSTCPTMCYRPLPLPLLPPPLPLLLRVRRRRLLVVRQQQHRGNGYQVKRYRLRHPIEPKMWRMFYSSIKCRTTCRSGTQFLHAQGRYTLLAAWHDDGGTHHPFHHHHHHKTKTRRRRGMEVRGGAYGGHRSRFTTHMDVFWGEGKK